MVALVTSSDSATGSKRSEFGEPQPSPNEALVFVRATSVNRGELRLIAVRPNGWRPGQDVAGVVERAAADGSGPAVGARVIALLDEAGWAERVAVPIDRLAVLPDNVSFVSAATLPVAGTTALRTVRLGGDLAGQRVLITGASGAVGRSRSRLPATRGRRSRRSPAQDMPRISAAWERSTSSSRSNEPRGCSR
jgi:NADPH:quinone reductase